MSPTRRSFVKIVLGASAAVTLPESAFARQIPHSAASTPNGEWHELPKSNEDHHCEILPFTEREFGSIEAFIVGSYTKGEYLASFHACLYIDPDGNVSLRDAADDRELWQIESDDLYSLPHLFREIKSASVAAQLKREYGDVDNE